jgi:hypothetical protein
LTSEDFAFRRSSPAGGGSARQTLTLTFHSDVSSYLSSGDILVESLVDNQSIAFTLNQSTTSGITTATLTFPSVSNTDWNSAHTALTGMVPDGYYQVRIKAGEVEGADGKQLNQEYSSTFFFLSGDANQDGRVNIADMRIFAANFTGSSKTYAQGDFNYDGTVNATDLGVLAYKWQATLTPPIFNAWAESSTKAGLSWEDNIVDEDRWDVQRSTDGVNWGTPTTLPGDSNDYEDTGLTAGSTYWYRVRYVLDSVPSAWSMTRAVKPLTLEAKMFATINAMIYGKTASSTTQDLYSAINDGTGAYTRNSSMWASGIDLSCIPVWNSFIAQYNNGVLITPRHILQAAHYGTIGGPNPPDHGATPPGTVMRFVDANNNVVERIVADTNPNDDVGVADTHNPNALPNFYNGIVISGTDIRIIELTEDVPSTIKPARVFPSDVTNYLPNLSGGIPVAFTRQDRDLRIGEWWYSSSSIDGVRLPASSSYDSWYYLPRGGDSSSGVLALVNSTPVVLGTWLGPATTPNISSYISNINSALGSGYSLVEFDPDS